MPSLGGPAHYPLLPQWQALSVPEAPQYGPGPGLSLRIPSNQSEPGGGPSGRLYQQNKEVTHPSQLFGNELWPLRPAVQPPSWPFSLWLNPTFGNTKAGQDLYRGTTSGHHSLPYVSRIL